MSNIVKFPGSNVVDSALESDATQKAMRMRVLGGLLSMIRVAAFVLLSWLRLPVKFLCNLISTPMLIAWLFTLYAFPDKHAMVWGFGIMSLGAFALGMLYDFILMAIAPMDMMISL